LDGDLKERSQWFYFNISDEDRRYALKEILESERVPDLTGEGASFMGGKLRVYTAAPYDMRFNKIGISCGYDRLMAVTDQLRVNGGMVLVDNDGDINNNFTRLSMNIAESVLLVVRPCYDELQENRWMLEQLREGQLILNKFILVVNGFVGNRGFSVKDIVRYLGAAYESLRFGKPAAAFDGCCEEMKEAFETLAGIILGTG